MTNAIEYTDDDIIQIATAQRNLMQAVRTILLMSIALVLLAYLGESVSEGGAPSRETRIVAVLAFFLLQMFLGGFYTFRLDKALKAQGPLAWVGAVLAGLLAPTCAGLIAMAMVSHRAAKVLKLQGLKIGFMGVSQPDLDNWQRARRTTLPAA
jgi:hypothetical protein